MTPTLAVVSTHPVQYQAPVYRTLEQTFGVKTLQVYGSDFSIAGYFDQDFQTSISWGADLIEGTSASVFLSRVGEGGATQASRVSVAGLRRILKLHRPSAVLLTGYHPLFYLRCFYEAYRFGSPILFRAETTDHIHTGGTLKALVRDSALRRMYSHCSRLLPVGFYSHEHYFRLGCPEEKLIRSPYCVDTAPFQLDEAARIRWRMATRQELGVASEDICLLQSGKLYPRKNADLLLRAVEELPAALKKRIVVVFMGDGPQRAALESLPMSTQEVRVRFIGFQTQHTLSRYYHAADIMALPSKSETWGLVVNEALHHGVPCVVSDSVGCLPDLVVPGITGEIAETGSHQSLAAALSRAVALTNSEGVRVACRDRVSGYTVERAAEGIAKAFWSVLQ